MRRRDGMTQTLAMGVVILIAIAAAMLVWRDCSARRECEDSGGIVVEYNCHTWTRCTTTKTSTGSTTTCYPQTNCQWRCEREPAR